jgi:hypothetical protein
MNQKLYRKIASTVQAYKNCVASGNKTWEEKHLENIESYNDELPSGSGFDSGSKIDVEKSTSEKIVINTSYHFMNDSGFYDGWEDYTLIVKPSLLSDFTLDIKGKNKREIKDYMYETFQYILTQDVD